MIIDQYYEIQKIISMISHNMLTIPHHTTSVFFMGQSGSGKGTLINYLMKNHKLYAQVSQTGDMVIKVQNKFVDFQKQQIDQIQISQKINSQTSLPKEIQFKGEIFKDFPGFHDNREQNNSILNQDIINQFYIKNVFSKTKKFKIVFLTSRAGLSDRGTQFLHAIRVFSKQFKDIKLILKSICLVVTKVAKQIQITHIKASLRKIQTELIQDLNQNQKLLLNHFVQQSNIQLFYYPQKAGNLDFTHGTKILKMIEKLQYSHLSQDIMIHLQNNSHKKVHSLLLEWNNRISHLVGEFLHKYLKEYIVKQFLKFQLIEQNKKVLEKFMDYLEELQSVESQDYYKFGEILFHSNKKIKIFNSNIINEQYMSKMQIKFKQLYDFIQFFKSFDLQPFNLIKWKERIHKIKNYVYQILQPPIFEEHFIKELNQIRIFAKSFYSQSSALQQQISKRINLQENNLQTTRKVIVLSYILNLDTNILLPGTDLIFITNYLNIPNQISIDLRGRNASDLQGNEQINTDGIPGLPGQNGGTLIIKSLHHSLELKKINIDLRGGAGGKGRNGGNIKIPSKQIYLKKLREEINKPTQNKQFLIERASYKFSDKKFIGKIFHVLRSLGTFNDQVLEKYSTEKYDQQKFVQTVGGSNGINGNMGQLDIGKIPYNIQLKNIINENKSHGYKQVYQGIYVKQMVFPSIRKDGRICIKQNNQQENQNKLNSSSTSFSQKSKKCLQSFTNQSKTQQKRPHKNSFQKSVSQFSLDPQKQQQELFDFDQFEPEQQKPEQKTFANSLNQIKNQKDFETQLLLSLFKFNQMKEKERNDKELKKIEQVDQSHLIKRKPTKNGYGLMSTPKKQEKQVIVEKEINEKPHFVRKNHQSKTISEIKHQNIQGDSNQQKHSQISSTQFNSNSRLTNKSASQISQSLPSLTHQNTKSFHLRHSQTMIAPISPYQYQRKQSLPNKLCRSLTFNNELDDKKLRKKYLQSNFQSLSKSQLLQLIKIRAQAKQEIIASNEQRDKFALMLGKQILNQFGKEIATDIGTQVIHNVGKDIVNGVANQVVQNSGKVLGKQILIKSTQGIGKSYIGHELGKQTVKQFTQVFTTQSLKQMSKKATQTTVSNASIQYGVAQTLLGISKSFILQTIISAILASGITDRWLIQPHFQSKKIDSDNFNDKQIIKPPKKQSVLSEQMDGYWQQFQQLMDNYEKIFNDICQ